MTEEEEEQQQQEDENKCIRPRERARGQKKHTFTTTLETVRRNRNATSKWL